MSKRRGRRMTVKQFFARLKFSYVNAKRSKNTLKEQGYVFLPNGTVIVDPRKSLSQFGYTTVPYSALRAVEDDDLDAIEFEDEDEDEDGFFA